MSTTINHIPVSCEFNQIVNQGISKEVETCLTIEDPSADLILPEDIDMGRRSNNFLPSGRLPVVQTEHH